MSGSLQRFHEQTTSARVDRGRLPFVVVVLLMGALAPRPSPASSPPRREVLIYIANETAPTASDRARMDEIVMWLRRSPADSDHKIAESLVEDLETFPTEVDVAIATLDRHQDRLAGVVIATNRLLQSGVILVKSPGKHGFYRVPFAVRPGAHPLAASSPLAQLDNVEGVVDAAAEHFNPRAFRFVLIALSHGDEHFALTPRIGRRIDDLHEEQLLDQVHAAVPVPLEERFGVTTAQLLDALDRRHQQFGLDFALLVLQTCHARVDRVPKGVERVLLAAGDGSIRRDAIDYDLILADLSAERTLSARLMAALVPHTFASID